MGQVIQGGVCHVVKQPKNDSPQNQDLTPPKLFLEGVQNPNFEYKNYYYYYYNCVIFPIISKILSDVPCIKISMA